MRGVRFSIGTVCRCLEIYSRNAETGYRSGKAAKRLDYLPSGPLVIHSPQSVGQLDSVDLATVGGLDFIKALAIVESFSSFSPIITGRMLRCSSRTDQGSSLAAQAPFVGGTV